jgi:hypothetical protein
MSIRVAASGVRLIRARVPNLLESRRVAAALVVCAIAFPSFVAAQAIYRRVSLRAESVAAGAAHFTFTRIRYTSSNSWNHDYPAADRNLSAILDYATNMRVKLD